MIPDHCDCLVLARMHQLAKDLGDAAYVESIRQDMIASGCGDPGKWNPEEERWPPVPPPWDDMFGSTLSGALLSYIHRRF